MSDPLPESAWVVVGDQPDLPDSVTEAASAMQATLGPKLAELRAHRDPFPEAPGPGSADRWITDSGRAEDGGSDLDAGNDAT